MPENCARNTEGRGLRVIFSGWRKWPIRPSHGSARPGGRVGAVFADGARAKLPLIRHLCLGRKDFALDLTCLGRLQEESLNCTES